MLVPAPEVTCHLLLPWLLGTIVLVVSCWASRAQAPSGGEIERNQVEKGAGESGDRQAFSGHPTVSTGSRWAPAPTCKVLPLSRSGIHTHGPESQTSPRGASPLAVSMRKTLLATTILSAADGEAQSVCSLGCRINCGCPHVPYRTLLRPSSRG